MGEREGGLKSLWIGHKNGGLALSYALGALSERVCGCGRPPFRCSPSLPFYSPRGGEITVERINGGRCPLPSRRGPAGMGELAVPAVSSEPSLFCPPRAGGRSGRLNGEASFSPEWALGCLLIGRGNRAHLPRVLWLVTSCPRGFLCRDGTGRSGSVAQER